MDFAAECQVEWVLPPYALTNVISRVAAGASVCRCLALFAEGL